MFLCQRQIFGNSPPSRLWSCLRQKIYFKVGLLVKSISLKIIRSLRWDDEEAERYNKKNAIEIRVGSISNNPIDGYSSLRFTWELDRNTKQLLETILKRRWQYASGVCLRLSAKFLIYAPKYLALVLKIIIQDSLELNRFKLRKFFWFIPDQSRTE